MIKRQPHRQSAGYQGSRRKHQVKRFDFLFEDMAMQYLCAALLL